MHVSTPLHVMHAYAYVLCAYCCVENARACARCDVMVRRAVARVMVGMRRDATGRKDEADVGTQQ